MSLLKAYRNFNYFDTQKISNSHLNGKYIKRENILKYRSAIMLCSCDRL